MGVQERSRGGRREEKVFSLVKKNFYRSICLVVLTATVVSKCIDGGRRNLGDMSCIASAGQ